MPRSNTSDYNEDEQDIVAEYENRESNDDQNDLQRNEDFGSENEDENKDEGTARRIDPSTSKKHVVRNPLPKLNTERLKGPKGIHTIEKYFEGFKFHGKGNEKSDLDRIMKRLEHWGHRLFPKLDFDDFLERLEKLGTKRDLQVFIHKYRLDMVSENNDIIIEDNMDAEEEKEQEEPIDEFDLLIAEQIEKQKRVMNQSASDLSTSNADAFDKLLSATNAPETPKLSQPKPVTPSQAEPAKSSQLTDEVKERIERNRQQAIQRKLKRLEEIKKKKLEETANVENDETAKFENNETAKLEDQVLTPNE